MHTYKSVLVFWLGLLCIRSTTGAYCTESYSCTKVCYRKESYSVRCSGVFRCRKYRSRSYSCASTCYRRVCCQGWTGSDCSTPVCFGSTTCDNGGTCVSSDTCACRIGYNEPNCADVDECASQNGGCADICNNNLGSYTCSCQTGYTLESDLKGCLDINECAPNNGGCQDKCVNTLGSYSCACDAGYILNGDGKTCTDLDECNSGNSSCQRHCENTIGSYTCSCDLGYSLALDGKACEDVDECTLPIPVCDQQCHNTLGSYSCSCNEGYSLQYDNKTCTDIDECLVDNGKCSDICTNTPGSYNCLCHPGYTLQDNMLTCEDIDECSTWISGGCSDICHNTNGSFVCSCPAGYELDADNVTCLGIDECEGVDCQNSGTCMDGHLSYKCLCTAGYTGNHCQTDIDECALLNGGCQDICTNTIGSFSCSCYENRTLGSNGASCIGFSKANSVFRRYNIKGQELPKGCWALEMATHKDDQRFNLLFLSTSQWYATSGDIQFTHGVVFAKVDHIAIPVSLNGLEIHNLPNNFVIQHGVSEGVKGKSRAGNRHTSNCVDATFSTSDTFEFIESGSFLKSLFSSLLNSLPNWIDFKSTNSSHVTIQDLRTELKYGHQITDDPYCGGVPVFSNNLYSVFKFSTDFNVEIYGKSIYIPKILSDEKVCVIVDICQIHGPTLFLINPNLNPDIVSNFGALFHNGLIIKTRGIGISMTDGINMTAKKQEIQLWNGDTFFDYPISRRGNLWLGGDFIMKTGPFEINGVSDMFFKVPNIKHILKLGYLDEATALISLRSLSLTLNIKIFGKTYEIPFENIVTFSSDLYMSIGGSEERVFCGSDANPPGIFASINIAINPFQKIPILKDWVFDNTHNVYILLAKNENSIEESTSFVSVLNGIVQLKQNCEKLISVVENALEQVEKLVDEQLILYLETIVLVVRETTNTINSKITHININDIQEVLTCVNDIWKNVTIIQTEAQSFIDTAELLVDVDSDNISRNIKTEVRNIKFEFEKILHNVNEKVGHFINEYDGFGMKYQMTLNIFGLKIVGLDIEMVNSKSELFTCSRFEMINEIFKGKEAVRFLGRASKEKKLGYFLKIDLGRGIGMAFAAETYDLLLQSQVSLSILGIQTTTDMFITKDKLALYSELNVWSIFLAQVDITAALGRNWFDLTFNLRGRFVAKSREKHQIQKHQDSFQDSYLSALVNAVKIITDEINKRFNEAQHAFSIAQTQLTNAQKWLADKKKDLQKAHAAFDNANDVLESAQNKVEKARGPFLIAMKKLTDAQITVDNLCKIKKCRKICIPGVKCKICRKKVGFARIPYPCCRKTSCMISFPDPICLVANNLCRVVRVIAYTALEAAKLVVRSVLITYDLAKLALELAEFSVDKARLIVTVAEGIVELANFGIEGAKAALEIVKYGVEVIKVTIGLAFKAFEFVIEYGLTNVIDVRNCGFEIEILTTDLPVFDVFCEVNAFKLGWKIILFRINFKNIFQSIWQAAKASIKAMINSFPIGFGRRSYRAIDFETMSRIHKGLHLLRFSNDDIQNTSQSAAYDILDTLQFDQGFNTNASTDYDQRVELFRAKCKIMVNILLFLNESFTSLFEISNDVYNGFKESQKVKSDLQTFNMSTLMQNITLVNSGISIEYAFSDYNISVTELEYAVSEGKNESKSDPLLLEIMSTVQSASDDIDIQISAAESVQILNHWLNAMENTTNDFFNDSECVHFRDCVYHAIYLLYDLYTEEHLPDIENIQVKISSLEDIITEILQNTSSSIDDTYRASVSIMESIQYLTESNLFCSKPPVFLEMKANISIAIGSTLSINCNAVSNPIPMISWYKDDQFLPDYHQNIFIVGSATTDNEGIYRCVAGNIVANITSEDIVVFVMEAVDNQEPVYQEPSSLTSMYLLFGAVGGAVLLTTFLAVFFGRKRFASTQVSPEKNVSFLSQTVQDNNLKKRFDLAALAIKPDTIKPD